MSFIEYNYGHWKEQSHITHISKSVKKKIAIERGA